MKRWGLVVLTLSAAVWAREAATYRYGATQERVLADEPQGLTHYVSPEFRVQDGLGVIQVKAGSRRVARLVSESMAARLYGDLAPDGKITAGDAWIAKRAGAPVERVLLSGARRLLYEEVPQTVWFGHDQLGSLTVESGSRGEVIGRRAYSPLGGKAASLGDSDRQGFSAQEADAFGGIHFSFRHLDPVTGRWSSPDPLFGASTPRNLDRPGEATVAYAYVGNNPANFVDPTGLGKSKGGPEKQNPLYNGRTASRRPTESGTHYAVTSVRTRRGTDYDREPGIPSTPLFPPGHRRVPVVAEGPLTSHKVPVTEYQKWKGKLDLTLRFAQAYARDAKEMEYLAKVSGYSADQERSEVSAMLKSLLDPLEAPHEVRGQLPASESPLVDVVLWAAKLPQ